jgi:hypothetical protein
VTRGMKVNVGRTYVCAECGHSRTYSVDGGES